MQLHHPDRIAWTLQLAVAADETNCLGQVLGERTVTSWKRHWSSPLHLIYLHQWSGVKGKLRKIISIPRWNWWHLNSCEYSAISPCCFTKFANQLLQHYFKVIESHYKIYFITIYIIIYIDVKQSGNKDNAEKYWCHLQIYNGKERKTHKQHHWNTKLLQQNKLLKIQVSGTAY